MAENVSGDQDSANDMPSGETPQRSMWWGFQIPCCCISYICSFVIMSKLHGSMPCKELFGNKTSDNKSRTPMHYVLKYRMIHQVLRCPWMAYMVSQDGGHDPPWRRMIFSSAALLRTEDALHAHFTEIDSSSFLQHVPCGIEVSVTLFVYQRQYYCHVPVIIGQHPYKSMGKCLQTSTTMVSRHSVPGRDH